MPRIRKQMAARLLAAALLAGCFPARALPVSVQDILNARMTEQLRKAENTEETAATEREEEPATTEETKEMPPSGGAGGTELMNSLAGCGTACLKRKFGEDLFPAPAAQGNFRNRYVLS